MDYNEAISDVVNDFLSMNDLQQADLARTLRLSQGQVSRRLKGKVAWSVRNLEDLNREFGLEFPLPALVGAL